MKVSNISTASRKEEPAKNFCFQQASRGFEEDVPTPIQVAQIMLNGEIPCHIKVLPAELIAFNGKNFGRKILNMVEILLD
jgi:hypothetical protein